MQVFVLFTGSSHRLDRYACQFLQPLKSTAGPMEKDSFPSRIGCVGRLRFEEARSATVKMVFEQEVAEAVRAPRRAIRGAILNLREPFRYRSTL
jgi:hypothetical protein